MSKNSCVVYWRDGSLYLNITNRCPNDCYFCFRKFKNGVWEFNLKLRKEPSTKEVIKELRKVSGRKKWREVVFCGFGEPLERLDCILEVTRWIKQHNWKIVRINTNGLGCLLNRGRDVVKELKEAGVDKVCVSLNAHEGVTYKQVCKPKFEDAFETVLEFIGKTMKESLETEITAVAIPEVNISKMRELAQRMGVRLRIREYWPCIW